MLGRRLRQLLEPRQLAVGLAPDLLRQGDRGELLAQVLHLGLRRVALAELVLDRLELLAQDVLALRLVELGLDLGLDPRADRDHLELAREDLGQAPQPAADVALLEQGLLLLGGDPQRARDQVRERGRVVEVRDRELELLGQVRDVLHDLPERLLHVAHQRGQLRALGELVGRGRDLGDEVGLLGRVAGDRDARPGLDEDPQRPVRHLEHPRDGPGDADRVQVAGPGLVELGLPAQHEREHPVAAEHVVDELDRALLPDGERRQRVGEGDGVAQRQDRSRAGSSGAVPSATSSPPAAGGADLDHPAPPARRAGAVRMPIGPTIGSSTVRTPSS